MPSAPQRLLLTRPRTPKVADDQVGWTPLVVRSSVPPSDAQPRCGLEVKDGPDLLRLSFRSSRGATAGPTAGPRPTHGRFERSHPPGMRPPPPGEITL